MNVRTISDLTEYVCSYGVPKAQIRGLVVIYQNELKSLLGKLTPLVKDHRKYKNPYFSKYGETLVENLDN